MTTVSSAIDSLQVINLRLWTAQEEIYRIRRMTSEEFQNEFSSKESLIKLHESIKKVCDLNIQRNAGMQDVDQLIISLVISALNGENLYEKYSKTPYKTY